MNEFDWQELLRRALAGGLGSQNFGNEQGPTTNSSVNLGDWTAQLDPTRGGYLFSRQQGDNPDTTQVYSVDQSGQQTGDPWSHTSQGQGIGSILGEFGKIAAPFALMALGGNYLSGLGGGGSGASALAESMGAGGAAAGDAVGLSGIDAAMADAAASQAGGWGGTFGAGGAATTAAGFPGEGMASGIGSWDKAAKAAGLGLSTTGGAGLLSGLGSVADIAKVAGPILGAVAGSQSTPGQQVTNQKTLDPRIDAMVFGKDGAGGLLNDAQSWYQANKSGQNDTMRQANAQLTGLLTDPRVMQGLYTQGGAGLGMMQGGVAANPFSRQGFNGSNWWG